MSGTSLPSIDTILKSTDVLSAPDATNKVVRVGESLAVKYGGQVTLLEAQNTTFVAENSNISVPKIHGTLTDDTTRRTFIVMDFVPGEPLSTAWPNLTSLEKNDVTAQIRKAMVDLRNIPSPGYIGSVARQPCADGVFYVMEDPENPAISGPFDTEHDMNQGMLRKLGLTEKHSYVDFVRTLISTTLHGHRVFFTHGDLQPKNIMVQRTDSTAEEASSMKVTIIDWEISGWYPEYWEFCNSTIVARFKSEWLDVVRSVMQSYPQEYLMMQYVRNLMFW